LGVGREADNLTCKNKFVENLLEKVLEEAKAHIWIVMPVMMI
jgi:hypothetical protein